MNIKDLSSKPITDFLKPAISYSFLAVGSVIGVIAELASERLKREIHAVLSYWLTVWQHL